MGLVYDIFNDTFALEPKSAASASEVIETYPSQITVAVGDLVLLRDGTVEKCISNTDTIPCLGVVVSKPLTTKARVLILGTRTGYSLLDSGYPVFLGQDGEITQDPDLAPGYQQTLGFAAGDSTIFFMPSANRTVLT